MALSLELGCAALELPLVGALDRGAGKDKWPHEVATTPRTVCFLVTAYPTPRLYDLSGLWKPPEQTNSQATISLADPLLGAAATLGCLPAMAVADDGVRGFVAKAVGPQGGLAFARAAVSARIPAAPALVLLDPDAQLALLSRHAEEMLRAAMVSFFHRCPMRPPRSGISPHAWLAYRANARTALVGALAPLASLIKDITLPSSTGHWIRVHRDNASDFLHEACWLLTRLDTDRLPLGHERWRASAQVLDATMGLVDLGRLAAQLGVRKASCGDGAITVTGWAPSPHPLADGAPLPLLTKPRNDSTETRVTARFHRPLVLSPSGLRAEQLHRAVRLAGARGNDGLCLMDGSGQIHAWLALAGSQLSDPVPVRRAA